MRLAAIGAVHQSQVASNFAEGPSLEDQGWILIRPLNGLCNSPALQGQQGLSRCVLWSVMRVLLEAIAFLRCCLLRCWLQTQERGQTFR